jgi:nitrogen fixation NifU-like protein
MTPYGAVIADHSRHPRNYGPLEAPDLRGEDVNPFCGDRVRIEVALIDDTVCAARFQGDLCVIAKAASSLLTELVIGLTLAELRELRDQQLLEALDANIPPTRVQCALLPLRVLQKTVTANP